MFRTTISIFLLLLLLLLLSFGVALAVDNWYYPKEVTVAWDPVTTFGDGSVITEGAIEYEVVLADESKLNPVSLWRGSETTATLNLSMGGLRGNLLLGIKTILVVEGVEVASSDYGWTDDPLIASSETGTFGFRLFPPPDKPRNFRTP